MTRYIEVEEDTPYGIRVWIERRPMPSFGDTWRVLFPETPEEGGPMSRELDEACARALGWEPMRVEYDMHIFTIDRRFLLEGDYCYHDGEDGIRQLPFFSVDPSAARLLEDEIERREKHFVYVRELMAIVLLENAVDLPSLERHRQWALIRATPEQRARAFLQAIEAAN